MKKILLCCAAGMSTSMLVTKMQQAAKEQGLETKIWAVSVEELNKNLEDGVDVVLLGPQIRYKLNEVREVCNKKSVPSEVIKMMDYGSMNGKNVLKFALDLIK